MVTRVNVRTKEVARNAGGVFDIKHMLSGQALAGLKPFPNGGLCLATDAAKRGLSAGDLNRLGKCFERGRFLLHAA